MSKPKELNFFIAERNFPRGLDWYRAHFDARATVRGESSPNYTAYPQHVGVPERMHSVVPDAKLLYMVRDPIDRIAAHWVHNFAKRREKGDLRATLMHPEHLLPGPQPLLHAAPAVPARLPAGADPAGRAGASFAATASRPCGSVFEFIGVDPDFTHARFSDERHKTSRKTRATPLAMRLERIGETPRGRVDPTPRSGGRWATCSPSGRTIEVPDVREALPPEALRSLREDAERLRELTGRDFATWSIWDA